MLTSVRLIVLVLAALFFLGSLAMIASGGAAAPVGLMWALISGGVIVVAVMERTRYRSEHAEKQNDDPGPGGGERGPLEPRFRATPEVFRDPTTGRLMRVYIDPRTGERRYLAET